MYGLLYDYSRLTNFLRLFLEDDPGSVIPKHYRRVEIKYSKLGKWSFTLLFKSLIAACIFLLFVGVKRYQDEKFKSWSIHSVIDARSSFLYFSNLHSLTENPRQGSFGRIVLNLYFKPCCFICWSVRFSFFLCVVFFLFYGDSVTCHGTYTCFTGTTRFSLCVCLYSGTPPVNPD